MGDRFRVAFLWSVAVHRKGGGTFRKASSHKNNEGEASSGSRAPTTPTILSRCYSVKTANSKQLTRIPNPGYVTNETNSVFQRISIPSIPTGTLTFFVNSFLGLLEKLRPPGTSNFPRFVVRLALLFLETRHEGVFNGSCRNRIGKLFIFLRRDQEILLV